MTNEIIKSKIVDIVDNECVNVKRLFMMIDDDRLIFKSGLHADEFVKNILFIDPEYCIMWQFDYITNQLEYNEVNEYIDMFISLFREVITKKK